MNSVDLFGFRRILDNPAVNFVYLQGEKPCRDSVVKAIRAHHTIAAAWFDEADVTLNGHLPGDIVPRTELKDAVLEVSAKISSGTVREVRVYAGSEVIYRCSPDSASVTLKIPLPDIGSAPFVRVEAQGDDPKKLMASTPFFVS